MRCSGPWLAAGRGGGCSSRAAADGDRSTPSTVPGGRPHPRGADRLAVMGCCPCCTPGRARDSSGTRGLFRPRSRRIHAFPLLRREGVAGNPWARPRAWEILGLFPAPSAATGCCAGAGSPGSFDPPLLETEISNPALSPSHPASRKQPPHSVQGGVDALQASAGGRRSSHLLGVLLGPRLGRPALPQSHPSGAPEDAPSARTRSSSALTVTALVETAEYSVLRASF